MSDLRGKFIVFEGGDGSGKSTQAKRLVNYLKNKNFDVFYTHEPGGYGMRHNIIGHIQLEAPEHIIALAFTYERALHTHYIIEPELQKGNVVISDRYFYSTAAYQGTKVPIETILELNLKHGKVRIPDLVLFIDLDPETAQKRAEERGKTIKYEQLEFQKKLYANYLKLAERPEAKKIKGTGSEEEVFQRILEVLKSEGFEV